MDTRRQPFRHFNISTRGNASRVTLAVYLLTKEVVDPPGRTLVTAAQYHCSVFHCM